MSSLNVDGAAARLLTYAPLAKAGYCLHYCWVAIGQGAHYIAGGADNAFDTWSAVPAEHQHFSREVPKDFPAFLGTKLLSKAGDVIISTGARNPAGELLFAATDWRNSKQVGLCTLAEREKQTGRKLVGWASSMGGHALVSSSLAGETGSPLTPDIPTIGSDDMKYAVIDDAKDSAGNPLRVASGEFSWIEFGGADNDEAAAADTYYGWGAARIHMTANQWRIEKVQIAKRLAAFQASLSVPAGSPTGIDYAAIAAAVNDDAARRLAQ